MNTGVAGLALPAPVHVMATLGGDDLPRGAIVKRATDGTLERAAAGDDVFGVLVSSGVAAGPAAVQIGGPVRLHTTETPGFGTRFNQVVAAGDDEVEAGVDGDPAFGRLLYFDASNLLADVLLYTTAQAVPGRGILDATGVPFRIGEFEDDRYLATRAGAIETYLASGSTASRPSSPFTGQRYLDTTLLEEMVWNGTRWQTATLREKVAFCNTRTSTATTVNANIDSAAALADSSDAESPWVVPYACRLVAARFVLKGGTGGKTWTARLRLDGSGSDTWTSSGRASTTSWQGFDETIDVALAADNRVTILFNQPGAAESLRANLNLQYHRT